MKWLLFLAGCLTWLPSQAQVDSTWLARMARSGCQQLFWLPADPSGAAATALAERDIQAGTPFLVLTSGEAPIVRTTDAAFERQFHVEYFEMGCTSPSPVAVRAYNARIAAYLQTTYGRAWRRRVRSDVVGVRAERSHS